MNFKRIYLTGFMGSGKTTVGRILADRLMVPFNDLDALIVERTGMAIPDIFEELGEPAFRQIETEVVKLCSVEQGIFGLGGGAILDPGNRETLLNSGLVIYLRAAPSTLARRLRSEAEGRPLLAAAESLEERISSLLAQRAESYEVAQWSVDTDDLTPEEVAISLHQRLMEDTGD